MAKLKQLLGRKTDPEHLRRGRLGEQAAKRHLQDRGMEFLTANYRSAHGEIDLVFRDGNPEAAGKLFAGNGTDCLVFAEVKTRTLGQWTRPASAVNARKRKLLSATALCYLREVGSPRIRIRFDIVEVLLRDEAVQEVRHLPNAFPLEGNLIYPV